jgi:phosphate/sulfate permease
VKSKLNWPQAAVLIVVVLAVLAMAIVLTVMDAWGKVPWPVLVALVTAVLGTGASSQLGHLFHRDSDSRTRADDDEGGA